jgi:hypothetical protein
VAQLGGTTQSVLIDNEDIVALMADGNAYAGIDGDFHHVRARRGEA